MKSVFGWAVLATALGSTWTMPASAAADTYPAKNIRFVIGFPAGSTIDNVSRVLLDSIRARTGATIVIENKPGALGVLGVETVVKAPPDGYTMMPSSSATNSSGPYLSKAAQKFDTLNDLTHVARVVRFDIAIVTNPTQGYATAQELIKAAGVKPKAISYGYGSGTGQVAAAAFARSARIDPLAVPYKGQPLAVNDLLGGQINFVAADLGAVLSQVRARSLTAVALASDARSSILPNVPTSKELGLTDLNLAGWIGIAGPAKLPADVVQWWNTQLTATLAAPEVIERLKTMGIEPDLLTGEAFQRYVQDQLSVWGKQIKSAGIEAE